MTCLNCKSYALCAENKNLQYKTGIEYPPDSVFAEHMEKANCFEPSVLPEKKEGENDD